MALQTVTSRGGPIPNKRTRERNMTRNFSSLRPCSPLFIAASFLFVQGCSDSTAVASPITLSLSPSSVTVARSATATSTVTVTRSEDFANGEFPQVLLTAEGLPAGVTATFNPVAPTGATSTMTLTATAEAALGTKSVTIRGIGSNVNSATASVSVTVTG